MIDFILGIIAFAFQAAVIVIAILIIIGFIFSLVNKNKDQSPVEVKVLNKKLKSVRRLLESATLGKKQLKKLAKKDKKDKKEDLSERPRVFVVNFKGDIKASGVEQLREEITAILMVANEKDQVVAKIESPGGVVHGYGLAASQLKRITDRGITLTACIDKVAASGGYMMASVASKIYSSPFAIIGSIGVIASMPNFNRLLEKNQVDYLEITAGEFKRTLTPLGKVTDQGMKKFKEQIEDIHVLFKEHVANARPQVEIAKVATGEYWFGLRAKELNLVDEIKTSDEYISSLESDHQILEISYKPKKGFKEKLAESMELAIDNSINKVIEKAIKPQFLS